MNIIDGVAVSNHCDYSFGDQSGCIGGVPGAFMKGTKNFTPTKKLMTLFIDNIRLYKRPIKVDNVQDQKWIDGLFETNDLLGTLANYPDNDFIIFTNLEDTPITDDIHDKIPDNVKAIYGVNAIGFGGKVHPFPYGVQRVIHNDDRRLSILKMSMKKNIKPKKLLYINHSEHTNLSQRGNVKKIFEDKTFATVGKRVPYNIYCQEILEHKFMICPEGNGVDCHRNWEVLYLKRVPIMKKNNYLQELYKNYPVLWVDDFADVNKTLLANNEDLYINSRNLDDNLLDLYSVFNRAVHSAKHS